jgi:crossover junction endodeoxyribonuclease RuvC
LKAERVIGVDPGLYTTGVGIVARDEAERPVAIYSGTIRPPRQSDTPARLLAIMRGIRELIAQYEPDCLAIEEAFFHKNVKSAMAIGQARGAALVAAAEANLQVLELSPRTVKQSAVGTGAAAKEQVAAMITAILRLPEPPESSDASDALAVALAALNRSRLPDEVCR